MTSKAHVLRLLTTAVAATALAISGVAQASPSHRAGKNKVKPVCNLIKASPATSPPTSLQVIGGDVASNAKMVTIAIRVSKLTAWPDPGAPLGREWNFSFVSGPTVQLQVVDGPFGTTSNLPGKATLDMKRSEIRLSVASKDVLNLWPTAQLTPGKSLFSGISATALAVVQAPANTTLHQQDLGGYADRNQAISPRTYLAGTPSCLKVGS
jgi:hypothetical protein